MGIFKAAAGLISSISASMVVSNALKNVATPQNAGKITKLLTLIGTSAIAGAVGEIAGNYVENEIDRAAQVIKSIKIEATPSDEVEKKEESE